MLKTFIALSLLVLLAFSLEVEKKRHTKKSKGADTNVICIPLQPKSQDHLPISGQEDLFESDEDLLMKKKAAKKSYFSPKGKSSKTHLSKSKFFNYS